MASISTALSVGFPVIQQAQWLRILLRIPKIGPCGPPLDMHGFIEGCILCRGFQIQYKTHFLGKRMSHAELSICKHDSRSNCNRSKGFCAFKIITMALQTCL